MGLVLGESAVEPTWVKQWLGCSSKSEQCVADIGQKVGNVRYSVGRNEVLTSGGFGSSGGEVSVE